MAGRGRVGGLGVRCGLNPGRTQSNNDGSPKGQEESLHRSRLRKARSPPAQVNNRTSEFGSGTAEVYVTSSKTNDPPAGSPVMVTLDMPPAKLTDRNSFGLLPVSPESARSLEKRETAEPTWELLASKAASTSGSA